MDILLGMLWLAGVAWAGKHALEHAYRKSRASRPAKQGRGRHAVAWWSREAGRGFPVTRAGFHRGWLAHQTAMDQHRAQREEAKTSHLEASIASELAEHRRRQEDAQARIDQAHEAAFQRYTDARRALDQNAISDHAAGIGYETPEFLRLNREVAAAEQGLSRGEQALIGRQVARDLNYWDHMKEKPADELAAKRATRRVDGQPETEADQRFFDLRESGFRGPIDQDGHAVMTSTSSDGQPRPLLEQEGTHMATATDTNYTESLRLAKEVEAEADAAVNDIRWQQMASQVDAIGALMRGDTATLSDASDVADALAEQKKAMEQTRDSASAFASNLQRRHGGIKEAHDDAPVPAAEAEFYED